MSHFIIINKMIDMNKNEQPICIEYSDISLATSVINQNGEISIRLIAKEASSGF